MVRVAALARAGAEAENVDTEALKAVFKKVAFIAIAVRPDLDAFAVLAAFAELAVVFGDSYGLAFALS